MVTSGKAHIISKLQQEMLLLQGFKVQTNCNSSICLGPMQNSFPSRSFPLGAIHEFLSENLEGAAATCGFVAGLLSPLMIRGGVVFWIGQRRIVFPPALKSFGIPPEKIVFIDVPREKHILWSVEEALKCPALAAVVADIDGISFTASRRLQLAVEKSQVTGFILCNKPRMLKTTASNSRWKISPLPSYAIDELPGVGIPQWRVELLKIRNGRPGAWDVRLSAGGFVAASSQQSNTASIVADSTDRQSVVELQNTG
jgi:protein ImuA